MARHTRAIMFHVKHVTGSAWPAGFFGIVRYCHQQR
jgi:hypothetical protein